MKIEGSCKTKENFRFYKQKMPKWHNKRTVRRQKIKQKNSQKPFLFSSQAKAEKCDNESKTFSEQEVIDEAFFINN